MIGRRRRVRSSAPGPTRHRLIRFAQARKFLTTDHGDTTLMSYAGPASRGKRADDTRLVALRASSDAASASMLRPRPPAPKPTSDHSRTVAFALGIAVGLAVGAGVALLFAPQDGADTRHSIARKGKRIRKRSRDAWDDLRDEFRDAVRHRRLARDCRKLEDRRDAS